MKFAAIDFETANYQPDSACAVGLVRVENGKIVKKEYHLIRPLADTFVFSYIHGITWDDVVGEPSFKEIWRRIKKVTAGTDFLAAHNARFDSNVLFSCCLSHEITPPQNKFVCTMMLARRVWSIRPTKLPDVCNRLGIELDHHNALSDAEACARIVMAAMKAGHTF